MRPSMLRILCHLVYYKTTSNYPHVICAEEKRRVSVAEMVLRRLYWMLRGLWKHQQQPAPICRSLPNLPDEVLLEILDLLKTEERLILAMVSRHFRHLIHPTCNVERCKFVSRLAYLRQLEADYPDHLVCSQCGFLWKWRKRLVDYPGFCPRRLNHPGSAPVPFDLNGSGRKWGFQIGPDMIELMLRADRRDISYGLPSTYLDGGYKDHDRTIWTHTARIVTGQNTFTRKPERQVVLASRRETYLRTEHENVLTDRAFESDMCRHINRSSAVWTKESHRCLDVFVAAAQVDRRPRAFKCLMCDTDYEIRFEQDPDTDLRAVLHVWRRFGHERMFQRWTNSRISDAEIAARDIQAVFESMPAADQAEVLTNAAG
jgi:hypothetical protein